MLPCSAAPPGQPVFNKSYAERTSQTQQMQVIQSSNPNDFL
jgi:hypothetical protein